MGLINYIDIDWPDLLKPILTPKTDFFNRIRVNREIIPIIFVPGIMGSRLKNTQTGESVWDPDSAIMCMLMKYGGFWNTPAQRKRMLIGKTFDPRHLEVNEHDSLHNLKFDGPLRHKHEERGWGGVFWSSYGNFLKTLENYKWDKPVNSDDAAKKKELVGKCFEFPVHAFGYNWTDTNFNAGDKLAKKIDEIIKGYKSKGRLCKYAILVSHSMGGLVCRSACMLHKADSQVLGVVHGVQPAVGAAAAYWRMKAGFERAGGVKSAVSAWVLGTNGEEVTCILGNAPGGLELLPTKDYSNNKPESCWLCVPTQGGKEFLFPQHGDPYNEIYKIESNQFWRLINPDWLAPKDKRSPPVSSRKQAMNSWDGYIECINKAEGFHAKLKTDLHKSTYQFYSSNLNTVDKITFSREKLSFVKQQYEIPTEFGYAPAMAIETEVPSIHSSTRGTCVMYVDGNDQELKSPLPQPNTTYTLSMSQIKDYSGGGDGTVPASSGNALKKVLNSYKLDGVEHQDAYANEDAKNFIISSIRNLALKRIEEADVASAK